MRSFSGIMTQPPTLPTQRDELLARLKPYGQEQLVRIWDELDTAGRERLAAQVAEIDFAEIAGLYRREKATHDWAALARRAVPPPAMRLADRPGGGRFLIDEARHRAADRVPIVERLQVQKLGRGRGQQAEHRDDDGDTGAQAEDGETSHREKPGPPGDNHRGIGGGGGGGRPLSTSRLISRTCLTG